MSTLPRKVVEAWENRDGPVILATVSKDCAPNIIYASCVGIFGNDRLIVADNFFNKTRQNILQGCRGAVLFLDKNGKAYQVKGKMEYYKEGEIFEYMKTWNPTPHPGIAAAALKVEEAYSGAEKLC